jgi:hypothetical protein
MQSQEPTAPASAQPGSNDAVFSTAHLVWLDLESGDELSIELFGPRPFLEDLVAQGFLLREAPTPERRSAPAESSLEDTQFRIHARVGRN